MRTLSSGILSALARHTAHSCAWRGLEASNCSAEAFRRMTSSKIFVELDVEVVRALVVAPAQVDAHAVAGHVAQRLVDGVDVDGGALDEDLVGLVAVHDVAAHGEVGRVDLQVEAGLDDALVLGLHRLGDGVEVLVGAVVVLVGLEEGDDARRRRRS